MTEPQLVLENINTTVLQNDQPKQLLKQVNLQLQPGDFVTVLGTNGAGKSTLFNTIAGNLPAQTGRIVLQGQDVTQQSEVQRAKLISRVFQDPKLGTAPRMTVAENLLLAQERGRHRGLRPRRLKQHLAEYAALCAQTGNGLERELDTPTGNLSGGQRQALSLLMATLKTPALLLLDEHTAALDPKTSRQLMQFTQERITAQHLTCLMITHHLQDALQYGNRLLVLQNGRIAADYRQEQKAQLTLSDLLDFFEPSL
ncbi:ABC-type uncharacterized transport system, ATPase component [Lactobacillus selangorensis]|uniref:ABC-type uncharacterized transport system, ATPase component n=1 Tax=Lactobacillus selangorensis TaxID=81857 RepID=A0A0R2FQB5_9LACO|nr:ATP-binding cassette domain-containing protein [Lactobacillus selangorensis]KRN27210.1 ABC-type uncharacterized transport system, ATPase component [Lactobacillus selangorensis]KRN29868.1 ABC-type uncharacterized transport system, ATPase component [Lactobacillus selangorensis]